MFGPTPLPDWVKEFRAQQWQIIEEVHDQFQYNDVVFLQAPTGTGKTLIGETVRRLLHADGLYCCTTKALQDQFQRDFPYGEVIKGRSNYLTESGRLDEWGKPTSRPWSSITCADCTFDARTAKCRWCRTRSLCPYMVQRTRAEAASLAVVNTAYLLADANKGGRYFSGRDLVIADEADLLETEILNATELVFPQYRMKQLSIIPPKKKTVEDSWLEWIHREAIPKMQDYVGNLPDPWEMGDGAEDAKEARLARELLQRLHDVGHEMKGNGWVYDGADDGHVIFRPVNVNTLGRKMLWPHGKKWLLMSATILSADMMADDLGMLNEGEEIPYGFVDIPSDFPVANRPIYPVPVADMSFKNKDAAWPVMAKAVANTLDRHPDERVLVHTVSYELARYITSHLTDQTRPIITYSSSREKEAALRRYKNHPNAVMIAASMDRGIDLPDDLCRVQVIAKIPFPNTSDRRTNKRMYGTGGTAWYQVQTIRTLIQMTGRGVRSRDDHAVTYILDSQFVNNLWKSSYLFPTWWKEALNWRVPVGALTR